MLCAVGAHWSYSFVPAGDWVRDAFGLERNHYDRFVHFSFGLLLAYPLKEWLERAVKLPPPWPYSFAPLLLVALSAIFECIEAIVVEMVNPELGMIFLGAQGDPWDAQKDIFVALLGGTLAMLIAGLTAAKAPPANQTCKEAYLGYDFDAIIDRRGTDCEKWDDLERIFGTDDLLPFWVADMDFAAAPGYRRRPGQSRTPGVRLPYQGRIVLPGGDGLGAPPPRLGSRAGMDYQHPGVVSSLGAAVLALTDPGDKIVIQPPVYPPFFSCVTRNGRQVVENPLRERDGHWEMDLADLESKLGPDVKMLILCSPTILSAAYGRGRSCSRSARYACGTT
jgi:hypothetical protein